MKDSRQHEILFLLWVLFGTVPPTSPFIMIASGIVAAGHLIASVYYVHKEHKEKQS